VPDAAELLAAYDAQLRARAPDPPLPGAETAWNGPLLRTLDPATRGWVLYRDLDGLEGDQLDALIARQIAWFRDRGTSFEWKYHGHDRPADLEQRLLAAGFVPEERETIVVAPVEAVVGPVELPDGVALREVTQRHDFERIARLQEAVWAEPAPWVVGMLDGERTAAPDSITIVVAEAGGEVVCAAWIRFERGTDFATLWGGATLPEWRRRGIYRATVAYRANLAADRGFRFLSVDASDDSRPILERLGFVPVTTTTPYIWSP
jgi:GNAT superfamily N-acetyltransferase